MSLQQVGCAAMDLIKQITLAILCLAGCYARAADAAKPNIIYILAADLGYGDAQ